MKLVIMICSIGFLLTSGMGDKYDNELLFLSVYSILVAIFIAIVDGFDDLKNKE